MYAKVLYEQREALRLLKMYADSERPIFSLHQTPRTNFDSQALHAPLQCHTSMTSRRVYRSHEPEQSSTKPPVLNIASKQGDFSHPALNFREALQHLVVRLLYPCCPTRRQRFPGPWS